MVNAILLTNSGLNKDSGGGQVSYNLIESLQKCSTVKLILCNQTLPDNTYNDIPCFCINPSAYGYEQYTPFFMDYLSHEIIDSFQPIDIAMTYACPFNITVKKLKYIYKTKIIADLAPHNIDISKQEHMKHTGVYPYPHLVNNNMLYLYLNHLREADIVIVHSKKGASYLEKIAQLKETPRVIPHGCYYPDDIQMLPERITPGYFGACSFDKGTPYLIQSWIDIHSEQKRENTSLLLGGFNAQVNARHELQHLFNYIGHVKDIGEFYNNISYLIHPSTTEGFGITVLEAMAYGRPVIVAEGAGSSELITDGKDGFVIPICDIQAIKEKITYFYDNPSEIQRMGDNARLTAKQYIWDIINKQYIKIYEELL